MKSVNDWQEEFGIMLMTTAGLSLFTSMVFGAAFGSWMPVLCTLGAVVFGLVVTTIWYGWCWYHAFCAARSLQDNQP
jgi:hypothetical protein